MLSRRSTSSRRAAFFRRFCAVLALIGVAYAAVEQVFPDVHDGDTDVARVYAPGTQADVGHQRAEPGTPLPELPSHHGPHVDHCAHSHGVACGTPSLAVRAPTATYDRIDTASQRLASVSLPRHRRPPIA